MGVIMAKTKIVIIQLKEIIYTAIFVGLGILLILFLVFMFLPKNKEEATPISEASLYNPGVYTSQLVLGDTTLNIEVVVDANHVNSVAIANLSDSIATMYPLVSPALKEIETQLSNNIPIEDVQISESSKYTQILLLETVENALKKAEN